MDVLYMEMFLGHSNCILDVQAGGGGVSVRFVCLLSKVIPFSAWAGLNGE